MKNFVYQLPTKFLFGRGAENEVGREVRALGGTKVLIHYGGGSAVRSGLIDRVKKALDAENIGYVELGGAAPVLWGLVLVALVECARTADGADGTVCGTAFAAMLGLMMLETRLGWFPQSCGRAAAAACIWPGCWAACRCASGMQS